MLAWNQNLKTAYGRDNKKEAEIPYFPSGPSTSEEFIFSVIILVYGNSM